MRRRADGVLSAEPTQLRYFVDTNVLGIIATRTHPLRIGYLSLIAAEEFDDRTPSISTIVVDEVKAGLSTLDASGSTAQQLAAAMRAVLDAFDHMDLDDEGQTLADKLQIQARAVGHPLGAPSQRNDLIIASLAIRHHAPLISHTLYFASGGTDGIPALRLGGLLRTPKHALHELVTTGCVVQLIADATAHATTPSPRARTRRTDRAQLSLLASD